MPPPEPIKKTAEDRMRGMVRSTVGVLDEKKPAAELDESGTLEDVAVRTTLKRNRSYGDIDITLIRPDPDQVRKVETAGEEFEGLVSSVREHGVLQPLIVRWFEGKQFYQIVAGERRYQAALRAGLKTLPVVVREVDDTSKAVQQLVENLQRKQLNPIEEAKAFRRYLTVTNQTQEQLARKIGKSKSYVSQVVAMLEKLTREEQDALTQVQGPKRVGISLIFEALRIPDPQTRLAIFRGDIKWEEARKYASTTQMHPGRPRGFGRRYLLERQNATVTITFKKSRASEEEIAEALTEASQEHMRRTRREKS